MASRKPGKYEHVVGKLPKLDLLFDHPERRDLIEQVKSDILLPPEVAGPPPPGSVREILDTIDQYIQRLVDIEKRATKGRRYASEFARVYAELRYIKDKIGDWESNINLLLEAYMVLMVDQMENEGATALRLANGQPVSTWLEPYPQVIDKEAFRQWCLKQLDDQGHCRFERQMTLHPQTMASLVKQMLINGEPEPDGVTVYAKTKIRLGSE